MNCLAPYQITCSRFPGQLGNIFIDNSQTKKIVISYPQNAQPQIPYNYRLLYQSQCNNLIIEWYEIIGSIGRTYTIIPGLCGVSISSFENGLLEIGDCKHSEYGAGYFAFGTNYVTSTNALLFETSPCSTVFEFESIIFSVSATESTYDILDCSSQENQQVESFDISGNTSENEVIPEQIPTIDTPSNPDPPVTKTEPEILWTLPAEWTANRDFLCSQETVIQKSSCESHNNPCITILPDGKSLIAYEHRDNTGLSKISLALLNSSISSVIYYYRETAYGTMLNPGSETGPYTTFEIFDDIKITTDEDNIPVDDYYIGFLTGPLKGLSPFKILTFSIDNQNTRSKYVITINASGVNKQFANSNNSHDIKWFIVKSDLEFPVNLSILDLPPHKYNGNQVPIANPSICTSKNHTMIGQDSTAYIAYQAYEETQWNVYLQQIRLAYGSAADPIYKDPIGFNTESGSQTLLLPDEYGAPPDVRIDYYPESLYNLTHNGNIITRVVYNLAAKLNNTNEPEIEKLIDINFVIDYSIGNFSAYVPDLKLNLPIFDKMLKNNGYSPRYGLTVFGQEKSLSTDVLGRYTCNNTSVYNGLSDYSVSFTDSIYNLQKSISINVDGDESPGYSAIQFALSDASWRDNASKLIVLISDKAPTSITCSTGNLPYSNTVVAAGDAIAENNAFVAFILGSDTGYSDNLSLYSYASIGTHDIATSFRDTLESLAQSISHQIVDLPVLERDNGGTDDTFLKKARLSVTYNGDLSYLWSYHKDIFGFSDGAPDELSSDKGLSNLPFDLYLNKVHNIDPVHLIGRPENWVFFRDNNEFRKASFGISYPHIGYLTTDATDPVLVSENSTRPKVCSNYHNDIFVCCEDYSHGYPTIKIFGTGDFSQNSITGPKGNRVTRFLSAEDFAYQHVIAGTDNGINQLSSIISDKNNVIHVCWQSNRTGYWNIYYACGSNVFEQVQLTKSKYQSYNPIVSVNNDGQLFITFHDNRNGNYEIFLVYKDQNRIKHLLEQDAYLASLRLNFTHYVNILPVFLYNTIDQNPYDPYFEDQTGDKKYNVLISFFDNSNFEGHPLVIADSRIHFDSFSPNDDPDALLNPSSDGVTLEFGYSSYFYFSTIQTNRSTATYIHSFEKNKTYFPQVVLINDNGETVYSIEQRTSFSCSQCNYLQADDSANLIDCSADIIVRNTGGNSVRSIFTVNIYADPDKSALLYEYELSMESAHISYFQINNQSPTASGKLNNNGVLISGDEQIFIQLYPPLSDIKCGISYYFEFVTTNSLPSDITIDYINTNVLYCDCASNIFSDKDDAVNQISRWHSGSFGYSDTRITNTTIDCIKPDIKTRSDGSCVIFFEKYNKNNGQSMVNGAGFSIGQLSNSLQGSGDGFWFDYDPDIEGFSVQQELDIFDRPIFVYETRDVPAHAITKNEVPTSSIRYKMCDFIRYPLVQSEECDKDKIFGNVITHDKNISNQVVKKILLSQDNVLYYTYNVLKEPIPIVDTTAVTLQIWGTPEVVAIRLKNENDDVFSDWCSFRPEISDYYIEKDWTLSKNSGLKQICIQAMTYSGVASVYCIELIADYKRPTYNINLYSDAEYVTVLPVIDGLAVASTTFDRNNFTPNTSQRIYVEIIPHEVIIGEQIEFDVLMQGKNSYFNILANKSSTSDGQVCFRGQFDIYLDGFLNSKDGISQIIPRFETNNQSNLLEKANSFSREQYNVFKEQTSVSSDEIDTYRQDISGQIGIPVLIRPNEDPYFIFGDHDFFTKNTQPKTKLTP